MAAPSEFPVDMVNVHDGREFQAESALQFNQLVTRGYRVKNKEQKDVVPSVTVASSPVVSDRQAVESDASVTAAAPTDGASDRPNLRRK